MKEINKSEAVAALLSFTQAYKASDLTGVMENKEKLIKFFLDKNKTNYCFDIWLDSDILDLKNEGDVRIILTAFREAIVDKNERGVKALLGIDEVASLIAGKVDSYFFRPLCQQGNPVIEYILINNLVLSKIDVRDLLIYSNTFPKHVISTLLSNNDMRDHIDSFLTSLSDPSVKKEICKKSSPAFIEEFNSQYKVLINSFIADELVTNIISHYNSAYVKLALENDAIKQKFDEFIERSTLSKDGLVQNFVPSMQTMKDVATTYLIGRETSDSTLLREYIFSYINQLSDQDELEQFFTSTQDAVLRVLSSYDRDNILVRKVGIIFSFVTHDSDAYSLISNLVSTTSPALVSLALKLDNVHNLFKLYSLKIVQVIISNDAKKAEEKIDFLKIIINSYQDHLIDAAANSNPDTLKIYSNHLYDAVRLALMETSPEYIDLLLTNIPKHLFSQVALDLVIGKYACRYLDKDQDGHYKIPEVAQMFSNEKVYVDDRQLMRDCKIQRVGECEDMTQSFVTISKAAQHSVANNCKEVPNSNYFIPGHIVQALSFIADGIIHFSWDTMNVVAEAEAISRAVGGRHTRSRGDATPPEVISRKALDAIQANTVSATSMKHLKLAIEVTVPVVAYLLQNKVNEFYGRFSGVNSHNTVCDESDIDSLGRAVSEGGEL